MCANPGTLRVEKVIQERNIVKQRWCRCPVGRGLACPNAQCLFKSYRVSFPEIACILLRSKWAVGKARGGSISKSICDRRATQPPAHFHRNPPGRTRLAVFLRCSLGQYDSDRGASLAP